MTRTIFVLGTGRSGTSAVAGVLHHLGVHMGNVFTPADDTNPHGTFEDREWRGADALVLEKKAGADVFAPLVEVRNARHTIWGAKDPAFARTLGHILPLLDDVRVVVAKRDRAACINSYMRAYRTGRNKAEQWYESAIVNVAARLLEFDGPVLEVQFDDLLDDPEGQVRRLMHFAYEGMDLPAPKQLRRAIGHVKRKPKREPDGWGDLALGVRIAKHPECGFFIDWTKLLTGGLRSGDTVLLPRSHQPAHWAATRIARDFLHTDKDTVLFVDDDMMFPMDAVHRLRENRDNWEYDMVMAFATHRTWPPKPVVLKRQDDPGPPRSLRGASFGYDIDIERGQVVETDAVGLAFTLIRRHVLEAMVDEDWGVDETFFFGYGQGWESDDIPFCHRARELGFRLAIDASVCIGHIGTQSFGWEQFERWRDSLTPAQHDFVAYDAAGAPGNKPVMDVSDETLRPILEAASKLDDVGAAARALLGQINAATD